MKNNCRFCSTKLIEVISFGKMPIANAFLTKTEIENEFFLNLHLCTVLIVFYFN